ncbi:ABC transporter ATP-binding protein [Kitasatospora sp. NPDC089913]|uniref:ABC transporter ATP-binding protein n=1 Tax=Streptomycetaceae TaxID=2062 RepID=UPI0008798851|nr:ABC transporter ATP-binding protein [Streptomyces sp. TLI_053]SDT37241.1 iron complex transport system ATP-binding protein [Streptomyces sp. TLI_053]
MRIAVEDLSVSLAGRTVVAGVHLVAKEGEIAGLVGPNGSGKSSLLRTVYRHLRPSAGRVLLAGRELSELSPAQSARHIGALPQERGGDFELTVREVVAMGRTPYKRAFAKDDAEDHRLVAEALTRVGMAHAPDRGFAQLSGGERQRVLLARALAQQPDVLVLDEPTNHLDVRHQVELLALLREQRRTTLVALHDLNAAASVCDRLHVLHRGTLVASGEPREVLTAELLAEVFGVRAAVIEHPLTGDPLIAFDHRAPVGAPDPGVPGPVAPPSGRGVGGAAGTRAGVIAPPPVKPVVTGVTVPTALPTPVSVERQEVS